MIDSIRWVSVILKYSPYSLDPNNSEITKPKAAYPIRYKLVAKLPIIKNKIMDEIRIKTIDIKKRGLLILKSLDVKTTSVLDTPGVVIVVIIAAIEM